MSPHPFHEAQAGGQRAVSRAWASTTRQFRAMSDLRKQAEIAVIERVNPSVSVETLPVVMILAALASLIAARRH